MFLPPAVNCCNRYNGLQAWTGSGQAPAQFGTGTGGPTFLLRFFPQIPCFKPSYTLKNRLPGKPFSIGHKPGVKYPGHAGGEAPGLCRWRSARARQRPLYLLFIRRCLIEKANKRVVLKTGHEARFTPGTFCREQPVASGMARDWNNGPGCPQGETLDFIT